MRTAKGLLRSTGEGRRERSCKVELKPLPGVKRRKCLGKDREKYFPPFTSKLSVCLFVFNTVWVFRIKSHLSFVCQPVTRAEWHHFAFGLCPYKWLSSAGEGCAVLHWQRALLRSAVSVRHGNFPLPRCAARVKTCSVLLSGPDVLQPASPSLCSS